MTPRPYPAKLLLFGEYTVLSGSRALAVPLSLWHGEWMTGETATDPDLLALCTYLDQQKLFTPEVRAHFRSDVEEGLHFVSNIPRGYGVGSSAAVCAAIYDRFLDTHEHNDILHLRKSLASMESHFHGTSSGMDPLVSLKGAPVLRELDTYHILPPLSWPADLQIFLIDSGKQRSTDTLVENYLQWAARKDSQINCLRPLVQSIDHVISFFIDMHLSALWEHLAMISQLQFKYFKPMIMDDLYHLWKDTLDHPGISIKLCGAGGGGFYLGFAKESVDVKKECGERINIVLLP